MNAMLATPLWFRALRSIVRMVVVPLALGIGLGGCGNLQSRSASLMSGADAAQLSLDHMATALIQLREGKPGTDYQAIASTLAKGYDTTKSSVESLRKGALEVDEIIQQANERIAAWEHAPAASGQGQAAGAERAKLLRTALISLVDSRSRVDTYGGIYLPSIYNIVADLLRNLDSGAISNRKMGTARAVANGDTLAAALADTTKHLKEVSDLLAVTQ